MNTNNVIPQLIKTKITQKNPAAEVYLFGSRARGTATEHSDWDILILLNTASVNRMVEREYRDELFDIELEIGEPISTFVFSKTEWETKFIQTPLYQNIKKQSLRL